MARAIERIEQDLAALEEATALLRAELHKTYSQYLQLLGQAVRRQLILASYQVCTHGYPEAFLSLSFNQRQKLQQSIQQMGKKAQEQLLSHLEASKKVTKAEVTDSNEPVPEPELTNSEPPQDVTPEPLSIVEQVPGNLEAPETINITNPELTKPEQLAQWQEQLEEAIGQTLETLSLNTNRLLQQTGIIPRKLPAAVLEAATKADSSTESVTVGSPNLLNLLMETESEDDSEDSTLTRIIAINLRLSEIEFADPALNAGRNQIRNLSAKRNTLHREYHKKQRERSVAQAEAAWRASWFED
ncbi:hypothetical protein NDI39_22350 [Microcoleus sp. ZQ-A2]|nr:hypothetical protein [Microcoleus sp. FACHB-1]